MSMRRRSIPLVIGLAVVLALPVQAPSFAAQPEAQPGGQIRSEWREVFSEDGTISRVFMNYWVPTEPARSIQALAVTPLMVNGPSASKFDLVFVGDGYTSSQLATY